MKHDKTEKRMGKELKGEVKKADKAEGHAHHLKMAIKHARQAVKSARGRSKGK